MKRRTAIYLSLMLLVTIAFGIALYGTRILGNPEPTEWIVDWRGPPSGTHHSISDALADEKVLDGDIIWVRNGTYHEHVFVNKSVTIKWDYITTHPDLPQHRPIVDGNGTGAVFSVNASDVSIFNLTIQNGHHALKLFHTATNTSIINNFVIGNSQYGIYVNSTNNTVKENALTDNDFGLQVSSGGNFLRNNMMINNTYNLGISNFTDNDIDSSNTVNGKPVYILINEQHKQVVDAGYIAVVNSTNITVKDSKLSNNDYGIQLINTDNSSIENVETSRNKIAGVYLLNAENVSLEDVKALHNLDTGIRLLNSKDNLMMRNNISHNRLYGILLDYSDDNLILENGISYNEYAGIGSYYSGNNSVVENKISYNENFNIEAQGSSNNKFFHNNILHDTPGRQTHYFDSYDKWDNNEEGNYWSNYNDTYPGVSDADGDGIWDHPYEIDVNNFDRYPLVKPWKSMRLFKVAKTVPYNRFNGYNITIHSDHTIASLNFTRIGEEIYPRLLSLNITAGSSGFCNITIPRAWLDGPFTAWMNGSPRTFSLKQNQSHSSLYFLYTAGKYQVKIEAVKSGAVYGDIHEPLDGKIDIKDLASVAVKYGDNLPSNLTGEDVSEYDP